MKSVKLLMLHTSGCVFSHISSHNVLYYKSQVVKSHTILSLYLVRYLPVASAHLQNCLFQLMQTYYVIHAHDGAIRFMSLWLALFKELGLFLLVTYHSARLRYLAALYYIKYYIKENIFFFVKGGVFLHFISYLLSFHLYFHLYLEIFSQSSYSPRYAQEGQTMTKDFPKSVNVYIPVKLPLQVVCHRNFLWEN